MQQVTNGNGAGDHAVVIGGSMAGLLTARVLSDHFARVTVIERDRFPDAPVFRKGVPQSRHLHILLGRGAAVLEQLFPGFGADMVNAGAQRIYWPRDVLWLTPAGWVRRFEQGLNALSSSRELLEWYVRSRVAALGSVDFIEESDATGLLADRDGTAIAGVQLRRRGREDGDGAAAEEMAADLVVDASGRDSRAPRWLQALGYPAPEEIKINSFLGYASRYYAIPDSFDADWKVLFLGGKPPEKTRGGGLFPTEGGRWMVTVAGVGRDYPPTDEEGFLEFARSLRSPLLYEAIKDAEPLTPIHGYQRTENQLRRYERLSRAPERFIVIGDAACAFNPIYGQGMTVAANAALALDQCLREQRQRNGADLTGLARRAQGEVAKRNAVPWLMATGEDLRYPTTEGARPDLRTRLMHRYMDRVLRAATQDATVNRAFLEVANLTTPPERLFRPDVLVPALRGGNGRAAATAAATDGTPRQRPRQARADVNGATLRTSEVRVVGVRSPLIEAGPSDAEEAVVFVHGNPGSSRDWGRLVRQVGTFARAVALDMPGFGRADKPADFEYTVEGYARHLDGALGRLGIRRAHLVLHDFGGPWGLQWAAKHPEQFASVVLIDIGVMLGYRWHYLARIWRTPLLGETFMATTTRPGMHLLLKHGNPRGLPKAFIDQMYDNFDGGTRRAVLRLYRATELDRVAAEQAAALRPLDRPALVIWGKCDPYVPVRFAQRQREVFPRAELVILEDSGHWPFVDNPAGVANAVIPFLHRQLGSGGSRRQP